MKKISTLFQKNPEDLGRVVDAVQLKNSWVSEGVGLAYRKRDGVSCAVIGGQLYRRYDAKINKKPNSRNFGRYYNPVPAGAIECEPADLIGGHHFHWVKVRENDPSDKHFVEAYKAQYPLAEGTYELCGPKVGTRGGANPENLATHFLFKHDSELVEVPDRSFDGLRSLLEGLNMEGLVFHHPDGDRKLKIRRKDFGFEWPLCPPSIPMPMVHPNKEGTGRPNSRLLSPFNNPAWASKPEPAPEEPAEVTTTDIEVMGPVTYALVEIELPDGQELVEAVQ